MKRITSVLMFVCGMSRALAGLAETTPVRIQYELMEPRGWVYLDQQSDERRIRQASAGFDGDHVRTEWFSGVVITAPARGARFELGSRTRVQLTAATPGVLLDLNRGRVHAMFDKLMGEDQKRLMTTPGAVLGVQGTRFAVSVNGNGDTKVVVFEGVVEVRSRVRNEPPVRIPAGAFSEIPFGGPVEQPIYREMNEGQWNRELDHSGEYDGHDSDQQFNHLGPDDRSDPEPPGTEQQTGDVPHPPVDLLRR